MSIPRIIIDDQYAVEADLRADLCHRCNLVEILDTVSDQELDNKAQGKVAAVVFCSGQKCSGEAVENSFEEVDRAINAGWPSATGWRWAMILLDIRFDSKPCQQEDKVFGLRILEHLVERWPDRTAAPGNCDLPIVMLSTIPFRERGSHAGRAGARAYTEKSDLDESKLRELSEEHGLIEDIEPRGRAGHELLIGRSLALLKLLREARRIARHKQCNAMILGPQGSGKTTLGKYIHAYSGRAGSFVPYYVKPSVASLQYGELFGYWKGAHNEAQESNSGQAEKAHRGTLVIEEVHGLKTDSQVELLEFGRLQGTKRWVRRLGNYPTSPDQAVKQAKQSIRGEFDGDKLIAVDVVLLTTSNYPLDDPAWRQANGFQEPLYTRLATEYAGGPLYFPGMSERLGDVPLLFEALLKRATNEFGGTWPKRITAEVAERLSEIDWSGNVAQLGGIARKAAEAAKSWEEVLLRHLPPVTPSQPTMAPRQIAVQAIRGEEVSISDGVKTLKTVHVAGTRKELHGALRDMNAAYSQVAKELLEKALDLTRETGNMPNRSARRKDPALGDLSPTNAITLLLDAGKLSATQAADEILRIWKLAGEPIRAESDLGRALAWAKKRRRGSTREKQEPPT